MSTAYENSSSEAIGEFISTKSATSHWGAGTTYPLYYHWSELTGKRNRKLLPRRLIFCLVGRYIDEALRSRKEPRHANPAVEIQPLDTPYLCLDVASLGTP